MKAVIEKTTKYYKYVDVDYASGNAGGMYHYWDEYRAGATCALIAMSVPAVITSVEVRSGGWTNEFQDGYLVNIELQASNDSSNWVTVKNFGTKTGTNTLHVLDCSENTTAYQYYRFYAENGGWAYNDALIVTSVEYKGYYTISQEVSSTDEYDYTIEAGQPYIVKKENIRNYYKYAYSLWTQPVLSSNSQYGITLSATNFNSGDLYTLMDGVSNSDYICPTSGTSYGSIYRIDMDYKIRLSSIAINYFIQINVTYHFTSFKVVAVVDGVEVDITPSNMDSQGWNTATTQVNSLITNCIIIYCSSGGSPQPRLGEITLSGQKQEVIEGTSSDYDFYEDTDKYYAIKSYEKGQYYGGNQ